MKLKAEFEHPAGVSVDASGVVWAYYGGGHVSGEVAGFTDGEPSVLSSERQLKNILSFECPGFAVDGEGRIYARKGDLCLGGEGNRVSKFASVSETGAGEFVRPLLAPFVDEEASAVAVDLSSDEVFLDDVGSVGAFSSGAAVQERFGVGDVMGGAGLAVDRENSVG